MFLSTPKGFPYSNIRQTGFIALHEFIALHAIITKQCFHDQNHFTIMIGNALLSLIERKLIV